MHALCVLGNICPLYGTHWNDIKRKVGCLERDFQHFQLLEKYYLHFTKYALQDNCEFYGVTWSHAKTRAQHVT